MMSIQELILLPLETTSIIIHPKSLFPIPICLVRRPPLDGIIQETHIWVSCLFFLPKPVVLFPDLDLNVHWHGWFLLLLCCCYFFIFSKYILFVLFCVTKVSHTCFITTDCLLRLCQQMFLTQAFRVFVLDNLFVIDEQHKRFLNEKENSNHLFIFVYISKKQNQTNSNTHFYYDAILFRESTIELGTKVTMFPEPNGVEFRILN